MGNRLQVLVTVAIVCVAASIAASASVSANQPGEGSEMMDTPPDPEKAVLSEYKLLMARGTVEAYKLFIERHPNHPLADDARQKLKRLRGD